MHLRPGSEQRCLIACRADLIFGQPPDTQIAVSDATAPLPELQDERLGCSEPSLQPAKERDVPGLRPAQ
jgi:hypothetical protein